MFCPNCGTQNPDTASSCSKCNFNLKGAGGPKFKGTMLMMNPPGSSSSSPPPAAGAPPPAPTPAAGAPPPAAGPPAAPGGSSPAPGGANRLRGTMVGVAPPMPSGPEFGGQFGSAPPVATPAPHTIPQAYSPPQAVSPPQPAYPQPTAPSAFGGTPGVNPLGGTLAAEPGMFGQGSSFGSPANHGGNAASGFAATAAAPMPPGAASFGEPVAPLAAPYTPPAQADWGLPGGAPQGGFGYGGGGGASGGIAGGAPQQQGQWQAQAPPAYGLAAPQGGYGAGSFGGPLVAQGSHGSKGAVRNGVQVLLFSIVSCGFYQIYWLISVCNEMRGYLQRDEPVWWKMVLLSFVTFGIYGLYWQVVVCGRLIQEMQQRAGLANPRNPGILLLIPYYNVILWQEELNKVWQSPT